MSTIYEKRLQTLPARSPERLLVQQVLKGEPVYLEGLTVCVDLFRSLCIGFYGPVHPNGICLYEAIFEEDLHLRDTDYAFGIELVGCTFQGLLDLNGAKLRYLKFLGCTLEKKFRGDDIEVTTSLVMLPWCKVDGTKQLFTAKGPVDLSGAKIGGQLACKEGVFESPGEECLLAQNMVVARSVLLCEGFTAKGSVDIAGAKIGGQLNCSGGVFECTDAECLFAQNVVVTRSVFFSEGFTAKGPVNINGASIGGHLVCSGGVFEYTGEECLYARNVSVEQDVLLNNGFRAMGPANLVGATIGGQLNCKGGRFEYTKEECLCAQSVDVEDDVIFGEGFLAKGPVDIAGATIGGQLNCRGGSFEFSGEKCLHARNVGVDQDVLLSEGFTAKGPVDIAGAKIGGQLACRGGAFEYPGEECLYAQNVDVGQDVFLSEGFIAIGPVDLSLSKLHGQVFCLGGTFQHCPNRPLQPSDPFGFMRNAGLLLYSAIIEGSIHFQEAKAEGGVCLRGIKVSGAVVFESCSLGTSLSDADAACLDVQEAEVGGLDFKPDETWGVINLSHCRIGILNDGYALNENPVSMPGKSKIARLRHFVYVHRYHYPFDLWRFFWRGAPEWLVGRWRCPDLSCERAKQYRLTGMSFERLHRDMCRDDGPVPLDRGPDPDALALWIWASDETRHNPQPYEEFARRLQDQGYEESARQVAIAQRVHRRVLFTGYTGRIRRNLEILLLDLPVRYGYRPVWAVGWSVFIWLLAWVVYVFAWSSGVMVPAPNDVLPDAARRMEADAKRTIRTQVASTEYAKAQPDVTQILMGGPVAVVQEQQEQLRQAVRRIEERCTVEYERTKHNYVLCKYVPPGYPAFSPPIYALDTFLPIIELHQTDVWNVDSDKPGGYWYRFFDWFVMIMGWVLSSLFVSAFTGIIKTEKK